MPDYLTINAGVDANDNTNYELSTGLSWYAGANLRALRMALYR